MDKRNGAVFIFAPFKKDTDCAITESPPNPEIASATGRVKIEIPPLDNAFSPFVHSKAPKTIDLAKFWSLKIRVKRSIMGDKRFRENSTSVKV